MPDVQIVDTNYENLAQYGICGYKNPKKPGLPQKLNWLKKRQAFGLRIKTLFSQQDGTQGMIEYLPGEFCWRPVQAKDYMFIHCLFVGFKKQYKNSGYATQLIEICENDALQSGMQGVAVVTRKSSFMVGKSIFVKRGYKIADNAGSDFELLYKSFNEGSKVPAFNECVKNIPKKFLDGLYIIRADQCPYTIKNVSEIVDTAASKYGLEAHVIHLQSYREAQQVPVAFGTFGMLYNGKIISEHPISNKRFINIMDKILN